MKRRSIYSLWILFACICFLIFIVQKDKREQDFEVSNIHWKCDDVICDISFEVANRRIYPVSRELRIRAMRDGYSRYGSTTRSVGEEIISIELASNELIRIEKKFKVTGMVNRVIVHPRDN